MMYQNQTFILLSIFWLLPTIAKAQIISAPDGTGTVIKTNDNSINITGGSLSSDRANLFHSFSEFNVNTNQTANFISQPSIQNILGRVTGGNSSLIDGLIRVTGGNSNLYLMNPAGIIFGRNASLNVPASFTGTTANKITFDNSLSFDSYSVNNYADLVGNPSNFVFDVSQPGSIINAGSLAVPPGQNLFLLGGNVVNTGTLTAPGGKVAIAAVPGSSLVRISQPGHLLSLEIDSKAITPSGINPLSLPELLTGKGQDLDIGTKVDNSGSVKLTNSEVNLPSKDAVAIASGVIDVSGNIGGTVNVVGSKVGIINSNINASGTNIGGKVLIGGDYQGQGTLPNALHTFIDNKSTINVDSLLNGDGGRVIVWADKITRFDGNISARGGRNYGDGGFVEVSGKDKLTFSGNVDLTAFKGKLGTLILDPSDINIVDSGGTNNSEITSDNQILANDNPSAIFSIDKTILENLSANVLLEATNNITVQDGVSLNFVSGGSIRFTADSDKNGIGSFLMDQKQSITAPSRDILISGTHIITGNINTHVKDRRGGNVSLSAQHSILTGAIDTWVNGGSGGNIDLNTGSNGVISTGNLNSLTYEGNFGGDVNINANGGNVKTGSINSYANRSTYQGGDIIISGGNIITGGINDNGLSGFTILDAQGGIISFNATNNISTGNIFNKNNTISFNGSFLLNNDVAINSFNGDVIFANSINGANNLTINAGIGNITFENTIGSPTANVGNIRANSAGITEFKQPVYAASLTTDTGGKTQLNGDVTTTSKQTYNDAVTIANNPHLSGDEITFNSTVDGDTDLRLNADNITFKQAVGSQNALNNIFANSAGVTQFAQVSADSLTTDKGGTTQLNGDVSTTGKQTYNDAVILANNPHLSANEITFNSTVDGNTDLRLNADNITFKQAVGSQNALNNIFANSAGVTQFAQVSADSLTTDKGGTTQLNGDVNTTGNQTYNDAVTLNNNSRIRGQDITFHGGVSSDQDLNIDAANITFGDKTTIGQAFNVKHSGLFTLSQEGVINLASADFSTTGGVYSLGGTINTVGKDIIFNQPVTLIGSVQLNSADGNVHTNTTINGNHALTVDAGKGNITFTSPIGTPTTSVGDIKANSTGITGFKQSVYAESLTTDKGGTTQLNGDVSTTGKQTYNDAVILANNPHLSANEITFNSTVDGNTDLRLNADNITFKQAVGSQNALNNIFANSQGLTQFAQVSADSLTTDKGGTTQLNGDVTTTGNQTYNDAVTLTNNSRIRGQDITFHGGVSSDQDLNIDAANITFGDKTTIGQAFNVKHSGLFTLSQEGVINLTSADFNTTGGVYSLGGTINTVGKDIIFNQPVTLIGSVQLNSADGNVHTNTTIHGNHALTVDAGKGNITFTSPIGTPTTSVGDIRANSTGITEFQQSVYAASLTTDAGGTTQLNGDVTTTGKQTYNDAVTLNNNSRIRGQDITFHGGVSSDQDLNIDVANITFGDKTTVGQAFNVKHSGLFTLSQEGVINLASADFNTTGGVYSLGGTINTVGKDIIFNQPVTLIGSVQLNSADGNVRADTTINGNHALTVDAGQGNITFRSPIGTPTANVGDIRANSTGITDFKQPVYAASLTTDAGGTTQLNGDVTTTGNQTYNDAVILANDPHLSGDEITFNSTVDGDTDLRLNADNITFNQAVGSQNALNHLSVESKEVSRIARFNTFSIANNADTGTQINADITSIGNQTYNNAVTLANNPRLSANEIVFNSTVDGSTDLSLNAGTITFNQVVGSQNALKDIFANSAGVTQFAQVNADSLTTDAGGTTQINADITTIGNQTYNDAVNLANHPHLSGDEITFNSAVDGDSDLRLNAGTITFNQVIGSNTPLKDIFANSAGVTLFTQVSANSLTTDAGGTTQVNGDVTTTSNQTYNDAVTLANNPHLAGDEITFNSTVDGDTDLRLNAETITFNQAIGSQNALKYVFANSAGVTQFSQVRANSLTTDAGGTTQINGNVYTTGNQTYSDNIIVANNPSIIGNEIKFLGTVNGFSNLTVNSKQQLIFSDFIGNITRLNNLTVQASGSTEFLQDVNVGSLNTNVGFKTTFAGDILTQSGAVNIIGNDDIVTKNITTSGGDITIKNQNSLISSKKIDSSNFLGNGGDVFIQNRLDNNSSSLNINQDITVSYINAQGGLQGLGGDVKIITNGFFRANETFSDSNRINASISTNAGIRPGSIIIDHGGNGVIPFFVGATKINGTIGSITSYLSNTLFPTSFFPDIYNSGNIQITTQGRYVAEKGDRPQFSNVYQLPSSTVLGFDNNVYIENFELKTSQKYTRLLGNSENINAVNPIEKTRQSFREIQQKTGLKSALIYVTFAPKTYPNRNVNKYSELANQYQLELLMITEKETPIRVLISDTTQDKVIEIVKNLRIEVSDKGKIDTLTYLKPSQQLYSWLISPLESELKNQGINNLMFVMDDGLRLIPLAALHDGKQFLIEKYSLALLPSFSLTDTTYQGLKDKQILAMGAEKFTPDQQQSALAAVPIELSTITQKFRKGRYLLNQDFNLDNLQSQSVNREYQIIHLATHANFFTDKSGGHNQSYIQLYDRKIHFNQIRQLGWKKQPPVELLVLSACRTAVGDEEAELGFAGLAYQTGVKSALASLWYVSDIGTLGLMTEFYEHLNTAPIKADALRQAQIAMLTGQLRLQDGQLKTSFGELNLPSNLGMNNRVLSHPYFWAGFTLIGSPW
ncbi:CHAT domain-containing protein [Aliinostoc sp. HNIBRCY26]|uniref:CHAT domain-containing protein n=1 Tax=Aliinostoc sp. HNIBRCY26 TaxID=3418997 RepID=UPI003D08DAD2